MADVLHIRMQQPAEDIGAFAYDETTPVTDICQWYGRYNVTWFFSKIRIVGNETCICRVASGKMGRKGKVIY